MKKTTYIVLGMFVAGFLLIVGAMVYGTCFQHNNKTKIFEMGREQATVNLVPSKYFKISDAISAQKDENIYFVCGIQVQVVPAAKGQPCSMTYPKELLNLTQKGDTLVLGFTKKAMEEQKKRPDWKKQKENKFYVMLRINETMKNFILDSSNWHTSFEKLEMNNLAISVEEYTDVEMKDCRIDDLFVDAKSDFMLTHVTAQKMHLQLYEGTNLTGGGNNIETLYLSGSNQCRDENYSSNDINLNPKEFKHVEFQPTPKKKIYIGIGSSASMSFK